MKKNFHHTYAESIAGFCQSIPPILCITCDEIDEYFRACALSLWTFSEAPNDTADGINQLYTQRQVRLTPQEFDEKINFYKSNPQKSVEVPAFFRKLIEADIKAGTSSSRVFTDVQKRVLTLCAEYDEAFTLMEARRMVWLYEQLTAMCDQSEIPVLPDANSGNVPAVPTGNNNQELSALVEEYVKGMSPEQQELSDDSVNKIFYPDPMDKTEKPNMIYRAPIKDDKLEGPEESEFGESFDEAMEELNQMIGLNSVKKDVRQLANIVRNRIIRKEKGLKNSDMSLHLVFTGNPGTGKTTVARLIGKIYRALGVLTKSTMVEVDRGGLVAGYVGQTAIKTQEVIDKAMGGILFIDEAYALAPPDQDSADFGQEAIDTILKAMEDHRRDFVVIVAGYDDLMHRFINSNPGLKSRFNKYIHFDDYDGGQLYKIFEKDVQDGDYCLDKQAAKAAEEFFEHMYEIRDENFGNARDVRNIYEKIIAAQADRTVGLDGPTIKDLKTLTTDDLRGIIL